MCKPKKVVCSGYGCLHPVKLSKLFSATVIFLCLYSDGLVNIILSSVSCLQDSVILINLSEKTFVKPFCIK